MADAPKTLLQMAGAPLDPSPLSESTLVIERIPLGRTAADRRRRGAG
jgi:hypothetical protein